MSCVAQLAELRGLRRAWQAQLGQAMKLLAYRRRQVCKGMACTATESGEHPHGSSIQQLRPPQLLQ